MLKIELHVRFLNHLKLELHVSFDNHLNHGLGTLSQPVSPPAQVLRRRGFVSLTLQAVHANPPSPVFPFPPPPPPLYPRTMQCLLLNVHIFLSLTGDEDMLWSQGKPGRRALGPDPDPVQQHEHRGQQQAAADAAEQWIREIVLPKVGIRTKLRAADSGGSNYDR